MLEVMTQLRVMTAEMPLLGLDHHLMVALAAVVQEE